MGNSGALQNDGSGLWRVNIYDSGTIARVRNDKDVSTQ